MRTLAAAIAMQREVVGRLPEDLAELTKPAPDDGFPFMKTIPDDPWGNPFTYERIGDDTFRLRSLGEDGERGSDDDIVWPPDDAWLDDAWLDDAWLDDADD